MKTDILRLTATSLLAIALASGTALAQGASQDATPGTTPGSDPDMFLGWDADQSRSLSEDELAAGYDRNSVFNNWDTDGDGVLSEQEFTAGSFNTYDRDRSGAMEEPELGQLREDMEAQQGAMQRNENRGSTGTTR